MKKGTPGQSRNSGELKKEFSHGRKGSRTVKKGSCPGKAGVQANSVELKRLSWLIGSGG
jgi:hypothetical protein